MGAKVNMSDNVKYLIEQIISQNEEEKLNPDFVQEFLEVLDPDNKLVKAIKAEHAQDKAQQSLAHNQSLQLGMSINTPESMPEAMLMGNASYDALLSVLAFYQKNPRSVVLQKETIVKYLSKVFIESNTVGFIEHLGTLSQQLPENIKARFYDKLLLNIPGQIQGSQDFSTALKQSLLLESLTEEQKKSRELDKQILENLFYELITRLDKEQVPSIIDQLHFNTKRALLTRLIQEKGRGDRLGKPESLYEYLRKEDVHVFSIIADLEDIQKISLDGVNILFKLCQNIRESIIHSKGDEQNLQKQINNIALEIAKCLNVELGSLSDEYPFAKRLKTMTSIIAKLIHLEQYTTSEKKILEMTHKELSRLETYYNVLPESIYFINRLLRASNDAGYMLEDNQEFRELLAQYSGYEMIAVGYIDYMLENKLDITAPEKIIKMKEKLIKSYEKNNNIYLVSSLSGFLQVKASQVIDSLVQQIWQRSK